MDKIIIEALAKERERQERCLELIASENYVSNDILKISVKSIKLSLIHYLLLQQHFS